MQNNEEFPCDLVVISSEDPEGTCYITTANLDGETNLKVQYNHHIKCDLIVSTQITSHSVAKLGLCCVTPVHHQIGLWISQSLVILEYPLGCSPK